MAAAVVTTNEKSVNGLYVITNSSVQTGANVGITPTLKNCIPNRAHNNKYITVCSVVNGGSVTGAVTLMLQGSAVGGTNTSDWVNITAASGNLSTSLQKLTLDLNAYPFPYYRIVLPNVSSSERTVVVTVIQ